MIRLHDELKACHRARLLLQVHDELLLEAPLEELADVRRTGYRCDEQRFKLDVPLGEAETGANWLELKEKPERAGANSWRGKPFQRRKSTTRRTVGAQPQRNSVRVSSISPRHSNSRLIHTVRAVCPPSLRSTSTKVRFRPHPAARGARLPRQKMDGLAVRSILPDSGITQRR